MPKSKIPPLEAKFYVAPKNIFSLKNYFRVLFYLVSLSNWSLVLVGAESAMQGLRSILAH
jgi:hypothetical protein